MSSAQVNRETRARLRDAGLCIACRGEHRGEGMRCPTCADRNRRGIRKYGNPAEVLAELEDINVMELNQQQRKRVYEHRWYWRRKVERAA